MFFADGGDGPLGFGGGEEDRPPERLPAEPARDPTGEGPRDRMPGASTARYGWIVGGIALVLLVYIGLNTLRSSGDSVGSRGPEAGDKAHAFAAPLATSDLEGDVNVATKRDQGEAGDTPACEVHLAGALNICDTWNAKPTAILFFVDRSRQCIDELDTFSDVARRHPGVSVVGVSIKGKRSHVADLVRGHRWSFPVVYDHDGVLANLYGVAVCPQVTYVRRGGKVAGTNIGKLSVEAVEAQLKALESGAVDVVT